MKIEFSRQLFKKVLPTKFYQNPSNESRVIPCGRTGRQTDGRMDGHDDANSRFSQFY
jgi:hypothetical protein